MVDFGKVCAHTLIKYEIEWNNYTVKVGNGSGVGSSIGKMFRLIIYTFIEKVHTHLIEKCLINDFQVAS